MRTFLSTLLLMPPLFLSALTALATPSQKDAQAKIHTQMVLGSSEIQLRVQPLPGLKSNFSAPWKLKISGLPTVQGDPATFGREAFEPSSGVARISLSRPLRKEDGGTWDLIYFICDIKDTWCKRVKAKGQFSPDL